MKFLLTILLFPLICYAQTDTLLNAVAFKNTTFDDAPVMGRTTSGGYYAWFFIDTVNSDGSRANIIICRVDLMTGTATYKQIPVVNQSGNRFLGFDSLGNYYVDISRNIVKINMKDSIYYRNFGNIHPGSGALAYSFSLGLDNHVYAGGSSGGTFLWEYDPYADTVHIYPDEVNPFQDYNLNEVGGNDGYIYTQTGQRDSNEIWAIRKSNLNATLLYKVESSTRFTFEVRNTGIYISGGLIGTRKMLNGTGVQTSIPQNSHRNTYYEVNNPDVGGYPRFFTFFDQSLGNFQYNSVANTPLISGSIPIRTQNYPTGIQLMFFDASDTNTIYYVGYLYGTFYKYNLTTHIATPLGRSGYNIYCATQYNDSLFFLGNYPSGAILRFHKNLLTHPWDVQKLDTVNRYVPDGSELGNNPRVEGYMHDVSEQMHTFGIIKDSNDKMVAAGDVIRTSFGFGLGSFTPTSTGVSTKAGVPAMDSLGYVSMALWKKNVLVSTDNYYGSTSPKIYVYNSVQNRILDSIYLGLLDNGQIYVVGDKLIGITNNRIYKYDLSARKLIDSISYASNSIGTSLMLSDGRIMICTNNNLPANFWLFAKLPYSTLPYFEANKTLYFIAGNVIKRVRNFLFSYHSNNESFQRLFYIKKQLGL
jgi:hypothetical protein